MDFDSGMILASNNKDLTLPPASITKMMTAYIAFTELKEKNVSLNEDVLVSKKAWKTGGQKCLSKLVRR
jgi:D-alanyl-D-alanine carboxypeptidase (penicillin-binding protein 5/6)